MVELYTTPSCSSCRKAKRWLEAHEISYVEKNLLTVGISAEELKLILEKTENGFEDIISTRSRAFKDNEIEADDMSMNQLINFIIENPSVLRRPILVDNKGRLQVGFNDEEIRSFLPRKYRQLTRLGDEYLEENTTYIQALERAWDTSYIESISS
ncbi:MAG: transcriptional regulator Spx [Turicibacter sp.]|nr:transcriptional regulator Spx [Turicibacter sp.]